MATRCRCLLREQFHSKEQIFLKKMKPWRTIVHNLKWTPHALSDEQSANSLYLTPAARLTMIFSLNTFPSLAREMSRTCSRLFIAQSFWGRGSHDCREIRPACCRRPGIIIQNRLPCSVLQALVLELEQRLNSVFMAYTQWKEHPNVLHSLVNKTSKLPL